MSEQISKPDKDDAPFLSAPFNLKTKYYTGAAHVSEGRYENGRRAWRLRDPKTHEQLFTATVHLPECADPRLDDGSHVLIKDWSENEGVLSALVSAGIVEAPQEFVPTGFVEAALCRVLAS